MATKGKDVSIRGFQMNFIDMVQWIFIGIAIIYSALSHHWHKLNKQLWIVHYKEEHGKDYSND